MARVLRARFMKVVWGLVVLVGLHGVALGVWYAADPTLVSRVLRYPHLTPNTSTDFYQPRQLVHGSFAARVPERVLPPALWQREVVGYVAERRSTALIVVHQGQRVLEWYAPGASAATVTNSMSMAKTVLALTVGAAIARGLVPSLDVPVGQYLAPWTDAPRGEITLGALLTMHSGLARRANQLNPYSDLVQMHMGHDVWRVMARVPVVRPPNTVFQYNNLNSVAVSLALEEATGRRYAELVSEWLWQPIGAKDAWYWLDRAGGHPKSYCCLFATAEDWARVGLLLLERGRVGEREVLPAAWIDTMRQPSPTEPNYGLHVWLGAGEGVRRGHKSEAFVDPRLYYLDGRGQQRVYVLPSYELVIVRTGEQPLTWDDALLPNTVVRGMGLEKS